MYLRMKSTHVAKAMLDHDGEYILAPDGSGLRVMGLLEGGQLVGRSFRVKKHAVHIVPNPKLGAGVQVATKDDGPIAPALKLSKSQQEIVDELDWHFKIMVIPVDLPWAG